MTLRTAILRPLGVRARFLSQCSSLSSGHNRWSKIKHDKGRADEVKTKQRNLLVKQLVSASRDGGPDPTSNARLDQLVAAAKKIGFPKTSVATAIARGQGRSLTGATLELITIEAVLPPGIGMIIECRTDSKMRTLHDIRDLLKHGGAGVGATLYMFARRGQGVLRAGDDESTRVEANRKDVLEDVLEEKVLEKCIEAGALDVKIDQGRVVVTTEPEELGRVMEALRLSLGMAVEETEIIWEGKDGGRVTIIDSAVISQLESLIYLEDDPTVQAVYVNAIWEGQA